jgi:hypothetical protein
VDATVDHIALFRLDDANFKTLTSRLEYAFRNDAACFYWDSSIEGHNVSVFDPWVAGFTPDELELYAEALEGLHGVLLMVFEQAPAHVVSRYVSDHDDDDALIAVAQARVEYMRTECRAMSKEWQSRYSGVGPILGDIKPQVLFAPGSGALSVRLHLETLVPTGSPRRRPLEGSRSFVDFSLTSAELARVISVLQEVHDILPDDDDVDDVVAPVEEGKS